MRTIKRAVHIDFHTMPDIPDMAQGFDAQAFAQTLSEARVEFINFFAKCNIGFAYYPTQIGVTHPYLHRDLLGEVVEACRNQGIGVTAYFNVGLDHEMARKRREWTVVNREGQIIYGDRTANFFRNMCFNTGYKDYMLGMIEEVVKGYPVEGVFLDCIVIRSCYCNDCTEGMLEQGMNPLDDAEVYAFARKKVLEFCHQVKSIVGNERFLYLNGLKPSESEGLRTHIEIECLPSGWSYDFFPAQVAYARNLGQQVFYMTGRFHVNWGDFGGLKSKVSLLNDCWDALSNAVPTSIGDHMHPRDGLNPAVYKRIGEVYREIEPYEPWTDGATAIADIAILTLEGGDIGTSHNGAVRMLGELKYTYDIVNEEHDLSNYQVVVLPDDVTIGTTLQKKLEAHLRKGGGILSTGRSGLNPEGTQFVMDAWGISYAGEDPWNSSYFKLLESNVDEEKIPDALCGIYNQAIQLQLKEGSQSIAIADYYQPYTNRQWDGLHGSFYTPPDRYAGYPAITSSGQVIQMCFNVFSSYMEYAVTVHKYVVEHCLQLLMARPVLRCENIPSTARVTVTAKESMRMLHIKLTHPEPRGRYNIIEDRGVLIDGIVSLRADTVHAVYLAPTREALPYELVDGYIQIALPRISGYAIVVVELEAL